MYGTPHLEVRRNIFGAWPLSARPYRVLVPARILWFDADHAELKHTAFTTEGIALIPASLAAMTNGLVAAVPESALIRSSALETNMPTIKTVAR